NQLDRFNPKLDLQPLPLWPLPHRPPTHPKPRVRFFCLIHIREIHQFQLLCSFPEAKVESNVLTAIRHRMEQYKNSITAAKDSGNTAFASKLFLVFKQLREMEAKVVKGEPVDIGAIPPPPPASSEDLN